MRSPQNKSKRRGVSAVEFALVAPVFLAILFGMIEFGRALMVGQLVTNAAREGARLAVLNGSSNQEVEAAVLDILQQTLRVSAGGAGGMSVTITVKPAVGHPDAGNQVANALPRDVCVVEARVPHELVKYNRLVFLANSDFVAKSSMRHE